MERMIIYRGKTPISQGSQVRQVGSVHFYIWKMSGDCVSNLSSLTNGVVFI